MSEPKVRPAYWEKGHVPLTFEVMREAYLKLGLIVEEMPIAFSNSPVKIVHDGVPYTIDVHHDEERIATNAAKFYILRERHHELIKSLYEAWQPLSEKPLHVMSGGGLQLQAFLSSPKRYEGILYLTLIDDGRFQAIEAALRDAGIAHRPYRPEKEQLRGPFTLDVDDPWFSELPDIDDVNVRNQKTYRYRPRPEAAKKSDHQVGVDESARALCGLVLVVSAIGDDRIGMEGKASSSQSSLRSNGASTTKKVQVSGSTNRLQVHA